MVAAMWWDWANQRYYTHDALLFVIHVETAILLFVAVACILAWIVRDLVQFGVR